MKIAYLLLCHKNPEQVARLAKRLSSSDEIFVIHVDGRANETYSKVKSLLAEVPNAYFAKRYRCYWGKLGIVEATLSCINLALEHSFDRAVLISGQDYPLKSNDYIRQFFCSYRETEFIESFSLLKPNKWTPIRGIFGSQSRASDVIFSYRSRTLTGPIKLKMPLGLEPHGGSQWWALTRGALEHIVSFVKKHPTFMLYSRFKHIPDEIFFQTILSNSQFASHIAETITFVDWDTPVPPYPKTLDLQDINRLTHMPDKLIGRKFDLPQSSTLMDALDSLAATSSAHLLSKPISAPTN